jgi:hypothetical protein
MERRQQLRHVAEQRMGNMNRRNQLWDVAEKLHRMIVSHDKAVQQTYLLGEMLILYIIVG